MAGESRTPRAVGPSSVAESSDATRAATDGLASDAASQDWLRDGVASGGMASDAARRDGFGSIGSGFARCDDACAR